jgi:hypothetical protein
MTGLDFFGCRMSVRGTESDDADLRFFFGPHVRPDDETDLVLDLRAPGGFFRSLLAKDHQPKSFTLRRSDGTVLDHREFADWSSVPSPLPPFRLLANRICVVQATVLHRGAALLALVGTPYSGKTSLGLELAGRGWTFVSDQLLVVERASGDVLPYCVPVGLRGATLAAARRTGRITGETRSTISEVSGEVVLVRPESLSATVSATARLRDPVLVHVIRAEDGPTRLSERPIAELGRLRTWPGDALGELHAVLDRRNHAVLRLSATESRADATELVESYCG